jgi:hypothetical protein
MMNAPIGTKFITLILVTSSELQEIPGMVKKAAPISQQS